MLERLMLDLPHGQINKARRHNFYFTKIDYKFLIKVFKNIYTARNARNFSRSSMAGVTKRSKSSNTLKNIATEKSITDELLQQLVHSPE